MEKLNEIWGNANKNDRHIISGLSQDKIKRHINNFENLYIKFIDKSEVKTALDWGCGGGLLSKKLGEFCDEVHGVDISKDSIENCSKYAPKTKLHLFNGDPTTLDLPKVDMVLANAIVWHFPSLEYFKTVVDKWVSLEPKFITFNTKKTETTKETSNYEKDFIAALFLSDADVESIFTDHGYTLVNKSVPNNTILPSTHFVFKKI